MSFQQRQPIADALSEVPGVTGYAYRPRAAGVGDAWMKWLGATRVSLGAYEVSWQVTVLVPLDESGQEEWIEQHFDDLIEALAPVLCVDTVEPGLSGDSPALMLTGRE